MREQEYKARPHLTTSNKKTQIALPINEQVGDDDECYVGLAGTSESPIRHSTRHVALHRDDDDDDYEDILETGRNETERGRQAALT